MKKTFVGIFLGAIAGIIDVIPMILQDLPWNANLSAFTFERLRRLWRRRRRHHAKGVNGWSMDFFFPS